MKLIQCGHFLRGVVESKANSLRGCVNELSGIFNERFCLCADVARVEIFKGDTRGTLGNVPIDRFWFRHICCPCLSSRSTPGAWGERWAMAGSSRPSRRQSHQAAAPARVLKHHRHRRRSREATAAGAGELRLRWGQTERARLLSCAMSQCEAQVLGPIRARDRWGGKLSAARKSEPIPLERR